MPIAHANHIHGHLHRAEYGDHFETPLVAYQDVAPVLSELANKLGKTPATLQIWDPYYCEGRVCKHLASLGFTSVTNKNKGPCKAALCNSADESTAVLTTE